MNKNEKSLTFLLVSYSISTLSLTLSWLYNNESFGLMTSFCSFCREATVYREKEGCRLYFCDRQCQYLLSAGGGGGGTKVSRDWNVNPGFYREEKWKLVTDFIQDYRNKAYDAELDERREEVHELFIEIDEKFIAYAKYIKTEILRLHGLEKMKKFEKSIEIQKKNIRELIPPFDQAWQTVDELNANFEEYINTIELLRAPLVIQITVMNNLLIALDKAKLEKMEFLDSIDADPESKKVITDRTLDELESELYPEVLGVIEKQKELKKDFDHDFPKIVRIIIEESSDDDDDDDDKKKKKTNVKKSKSIVEKKSKKIEVKKSEKIEEKKEEEEEDDVESIVIDRVEVIPGMTSDQMNVFNGVEKIIIDNEQNLRVLPGEFAVVRYLNNCDVIMHLPLLIFLKNVVPKRDTYLRNMFEVGSGQGNNSKELRLKWETKIFQSKKYDAFDAHDKVKYGAVNWANARVGVWNAAKIYGESYLVFKSNVKDRCTYARYDSSSDWVKGPRDLGCKKSMYYIARKFSAKEIASMIYYDSDEEKENLIMNDIKDYMEVQIHGELLMERDIARIMISPEYRDNKEFMSLLNSYFKIIGREIDYEFI